MSFPPKPLKIQCRTCGYKAVYNPNSDCLAIRPPSNQRCPHCHSTCEITNAKAIRVANTWIVIERLPYKRLG